MADIFREVTDIWPYRHPVQSQNTLSYHVSVDCNDNQDDVDHDPRPFHPFLPVHCVRIPALMLHYTPNLDNLPSQKALEESWRNLPMREEPKTHVYVSPEFETLEQITLYWHNKAEPYQPPAQEFLFGSACTLNVVYPCFKQVPNNPPDMVYGVCFCRRTRDIYLDIITYTRTYLRYDVEDVESELAFDITEDFINENAIDQDPRHYTNGNLFERWDRFDRRNSIAFYVCRGARLMVLDVRSPTPVGQEKHTRSLYQAGSLVVCTGNRGISIGTTRRDGKPDDSGWSGLFTQQDGLLWPLQRARRDLDNWERGRDPGVRLNDYVDHVIFLGAIESEFNSACWKLDILDHHDKNFCQIFLTTPNEGTIEDIAPWNSGFELIRARQRYEQPWRDVVQYPELAITRVPQFELPNDHEYVIPRILGVGEWGPLVINYPYTDYHLPRLPRFTQWGSIHRYMADFLCIYDPELHQIDYPSLRHFEQLTDWHQSAWKDVMLPPAPPLLPPIKSHQGYKYLEKDTKVCMVGHFADQVVFKVSGYPGHYLLKYAENEPGYKWVYLTKANQIQVLQHMLWTPNFEWDEWTRYSVGHKWYIKLSVNSVYHTKMFFLQEYP